MMNDLDTLRPEVADAVSALDETTCMTNPGLKWYATIRAELLRLADENARLRERVSDTEHFRDVHIRAAGIFRKRAEKAEAELAAALKANRDCVDHFEQMQAELAALKARIAEAPMAQLIDQGRATQQWYVRATDGGLLALPPALSGKRVRLVVEE